MSRESRADKLTLEQYTKKTHVNFSRSTKYPDPKRGPSTLQLVSQTSCTRPSTRNRSERRSTRGNICHASNQEDTPTHVDGLEFLLAGVVANEWYYTLSAARGKYLKPCWALNVATSRRICSVARSHTSKSAVWALSSMGRWSSRTIHQNHR